MWINKQFIHAIQKKLAYNRQGDISRDTGKLTKNIFFLFFNKKNDQGLSNMLRTNIAKKYILKWKEKDLDRVNKALFP